MWTTVRISTFRKQATIPTGICVSSLPWLLLSVSGWVIAAQDSRLPSRSPRMQAAITLSPRLVPGMVSTSG